MSKQPKPREYTQDEVQDLFLEHIRNMVDYAENEDQWSTVRRKLEGLAFCIMVAIDGGTELPAFSLIPHPVSPDDKEWYISEGENWYPEFPDVDVCDIGGSLHERLFNR